MKNRVIWRRYEGDIEVIWAVNGIISANKMGSPGIVGLPIAHLRIQLSWISSFFRRSS